MSIYNYGVINEEDHIRLISAHWNYQGRSHPKSLEMGVLDSSLSGIVLVHDLITEEYKAYWGTFAVHCGSSVSPLEAARHIAQWGNRVPDSIRDAWWPFIEDLRKENAKTA